MVNLQKGLVGHWTMDSIDTDSGMIRDRSGYDNHGIIDGATPGYPGNNGTAFYFDGNDKIDIPNVSIPPSDFTVCAWIKVDSIDSGDNGILGRGSNSLQFDFSGADSLRVFSSDGSFETPTTQSEWDDGYHWVAAKQEPNGNVTIFRDSNVLGSGNVQSISGSFGRIGAIDKDGGRYFDGRIDDVRIYNRALSDKEIKSLYNIRSRRSYGSPYVPPSIPDETPDETPDAIPDSGILRYSFEDNNAIDEWGDFDGTVNGATHQPSGGPDGSGAFDFDGSDDFIEVPSGATDAIESAGAGSVYALVELTDLNNDYFIFGNNDDGRLLLYMDAGGAAEGYRGGSGSFTSVDVGGASTNYQSVVLTIGDGTTSVYTDGSLTNSKSGKLQSGINGLDIARQPPNGRYLDGRLADFRIYDKVLSDTEVSNLDSTGSING